MPVARRRRPIAITAAVVSLLLLSALGYAAFLGYFGGPVYRLTPAVGAPPPARRDTAVLFLSGDNGLKIGMGPHLIRAIADHGLPVLGVNTLTAFAGGRSPAEARALVADAVRRALALPGIGHVVVIGQSFGADMLQYGMATLPAPLRPHVVQVLLAVPGDTLVFEATPAGIFYGAADGPALPSARAIDWLPLLCVHGAQEENSLCPHLTGRNVRVVTLPGDHYLDYDAARLADTLWQAILRGR